MTSAEEKKKKRRSFEEWMWWALPRRLTSFKSLSTCERYKSAGINAGDKTKVKKKRRRDAFRSARVKKWCNKRKSECRRLQPIRDSESPHMTCFIKSGANMSWRQRSDQSDGEWVKHPGERENDWTGINQNFSRRKGEISKKKKKKSKKEKKKKGKTVSQKKKKLLKMTAKAWWLTGIVSRAY